MARYCTNCGAVFATGAPEEMLKCASCRALVVKCALFQHDYHASPEVIGTWQCTVCKERLLSVEISTVPVLAPHVAVDFDC